MFELLAGFRDLCWPPTCAGCGGAARADLCATCHRSLPRIESKLCTLCQERPRLGGEPRCFVCAARRRPLAACIAGVRFESDAADWIRDFKYASPWRVSLGAAERGRIRILARIAAGCVPGPGPQALVPIPLHPRRLWARGFNPAVSIACEFARITDSPVSFALVRSRDTPSQTGLNRAARRRNLAGAFAMRATVPKRVWLVDDVVTTGATLESAARTLRRAGVEEIVGVCLARTRLGERTEPNPEVRGRRGVGKDGTGAL